MKLLISYVHGVACACTVPLGSQAFVAIYVYVRMRDSTRVTQQPGGRMCLAQRYCCQRTKMVF